MFQEDRRLATGGTSDVYEWQEGQVLKLFLKRSEYHPHEIIATRAAHEAGLPVPAVMGTDLIEVDGREGIVFERVNGPTMAQYVNEHPDEVASCARAMAALHTDMHEHPAPTTLITYPEVLTFAIGKTDALEPKAKETILRVLDSLPVGQMMCHGDFHPNNIIMAEQGLVIIDWGVGTRGNPLADFAESSLLAMAWPWFLIERGRPESLHILWREFWDIYLERYRELRPYSEKEFKSWQLVVAAALLFLGRKPPSCWYTFIEDTLQEGIEI